MSYAAPRAVDDELTDQLVELLARLSEVFVLMQQGDELSIATSSRPVRDECATLARRRAYLLPAWGHATATNE
jgi:hypothetical protein